MLSGPTSAVKFGKQERGAAVSRTRNVEARLVFKKVQISFRWKSTLALAFKAQRRAKCGEYLLVMPGSILYYFFSNIF